MPSIKSNDLNKKPRKPDDPICDDGIVISGMAGLYPDCDNVKELSEFLYNQVIPNPSESKPRWNLKHPEIIGHDVKKIRGLELFDAQFFRVNYRQAHKMDPLCRKLLEQTFQAIYDAGISPEHLNGKKCGVFVGCGFTESEKAFSTASNFDSTVDGFGLTGCNRAMFANRISYWLNIKGPSVTMDQACCSGTAALELAYQAMIRGDCEAAVVGGTNLVLHPHSLLHCHRAMLLSPDGRIRSFDENANGCARSEAINVLFLQKAKDAKRIYAEVINVKSHFTTLIKDVTGPKYGFYRDVSNMAEFTQTFYDESNVLPQDVKYVEAFGSGIPDADKAELEAIEKVYCKGRKDTLLVGSVLSNIGYSESTTGISAITKVLLGYNTGSIAANMNFDSPRKDVKALVDGRMSVVKEHQPFKAAFAAVNGLSFSGVNSLTLLKGLNKKKDTKRYKSNIPYLVTISGRQETSVEKILENLTTRPIDPEELVLLHNIHEKRISGHLGRGFTILDINQEGNTVSLNEMSDYFDDAKRPIWFVYSGMGSQWTGMGKQLMRISIFAAAIERCRVILEPKGVDIIEIITSKDERLFDNILNSFVGIAAIQIGLTDILRELGIVPDKIIGHSVGELGCAYADGCFTAEEMILAAYYRGLVSTEVPFIKGTMAAVGMGYQQILKMLPPEIEVACHNSVDSSTISGPEDSVKKFVDVLVSKGIFAKEVNTSNIAYHSRYIADAGPSFLNSLQNLIKDPKRRSDRWLSTSVPQDKWEEPSALYSSAEYHTNNLLNQVLFEEVLPLVPVDAILIEIAPHGLLQAILKRSLSKACTNIPLVRRGHPDNVRHLLESIGQLYMVGCNPTIRVLYPKVEFPVSPGTPMLSHLVDWSHIENWSVPYYASAIKKNAAACKFAISTYDTEHRYLKGHIIKEKNVFPFAAALVAVWDTWAMTLGLEKKKLSVRFKHVHFHSQPPLYNHNQLQLSVALHRGGGRFEVTDNKSKVISGYIDQELNTKVYENEIDPMGERKLSAEDVYKLLYLRDYNYVDDFRSINSVNESLTEAEIIWKDNWVTFIDGIMQLNTLRQNHDNISQLRFIKEINIDVNKHFDESVADGATVRIATVDELRNSTRCGGVFVETIRYRNLQTETNNDLNTVKTLQFVPHFSSYHIDELSLLYLYLQVVAENLNKESINILKIENKHAETLKLNINHIKRYSPELNIKLDVVQKCKILTEQKSVLSNFDILIVDNLSTDDQMRQVFCKFVPQNTFLINAEEHFNQRPSSSYRAVCAHNTNTARVELLRWKHLSNTAGTSVVSVYTQSELQLFFDTLASISSNQNLFVVSSYPALPQLKDTVKWCRKKTNKNISLIMVENKSAYQICNYTQNPELIYNVVFDDVLGGEYYLPMTEKSSHTNRMMLETVGIGDFNTLRWVEVPRISGPGILVKVHYAGLSVVDIQHKSSGIRTDNQINFNTCGMDYSGVIEGTGTRIMGIVKSGSIKSHINPETDLMWPVPEHWSLEDAATVPLAYCLAFYCLVMKSNLCPGMRVFVHGGTGALAQAIISIALAYRCEVFTTVSSLSKRRFLRRLFPELDDEHIGNSRDDSFADMVITKTNGKCCDIVICTVKGELKTTTLKCAGPFGTTVDTTILQDQEYYDLGLDFMWYCRTYKTVDLSTIFLEENKEVAKDLQLLVSDGILQGYVRPLTRVTYATQDASRAFRLLSTSRHRGRVLLNLQQIQAPDQPRIICSSELYHYVVSDDDVLGIRLAERLIKRGARKLHLQFINPSNILHFKVMTWKEQGIQARISYNNILNEMNVEDLGKNEDVRSIEGIYVLATDQKFAQEMEHSIELLNMKRSKCYTSLKYFIFTEIDEKFTEKRCESSNIQMPAKLKLPRIKQVGRNQDESQKDLITAAHVVDAIEVTMSAEKSANLVISWTKPQDNIIQNILAIAGIDVHEDRFNGADTLQELGLETSQITSILYYLCDTKNVSLSKENILSMTLQEIRELETNFESKDNYIKLHGLWNFISYIDPDEIEATTNMSFMSTLVNNCEQKTDDFDTTQSYLCIVPGLEGHYKRFQKVCKRLKLPALVLQPGFEKPNLTIREIAQKYVETMPKHDNLCKRFHLLGYETGVLIALEMAAILEDEGWLGTVYCIGGSPNEIKAIFDDILEDIKTEETLEEAVIRHLYTLMTGNSTNKLDDLLKNAFTLQEKVEACINVTRGCVTYTKQFIREMIYNTYSMILQVRNYDIKPRPLRSLLISLRPSSNISHKSSNLQKYSLQPVFEYDLSAPLAYSTDDLNCAAIINDHLDKKLLDEFEKRNICETYIVNEGQLFMANLLDL